MIKIEEKVKKLINQQIESEGYEIYDIEYVKEGKEYYLRIFIEKADGNITIEDCENVNNIINPILDEAAVIKNQYYLEVSSTGLEKNLRTKEHYDKAIGKEIKIKLFKKDEHGNKEIEGTLKKIDNEEITIEKNGKNINIEIKDIAQAKTIYNWDK